jgi:hypothetical protein
VKLFRVMKVDADGKPLVGTRRNMLGVRPFDPNSNDPSRKFDVDAVKGSDPVLPGTSRGLSVSTSSDRFVLGVGEAIWELDTDELPPELVPIPDGPPHHILEPAKPTTLDDYQAVLIGTRDLWVRVP